MQISKFPGGRTGRLAQRGAPRRPMNAVSLDFQTLSTGAEDRIRAEPVLSPQALAAMRLGASLYIPATRTDLAAIANGVKSPGLRSVIFAPRIR